METIVESIPGPGPACLRPRTADLARQVQDKAAQISRNEHQPKVATRAAKAMKELAKMMELIQSRRISYPSLDPILQHIFRTITEYGNYVESQNPKSTLGRLWHRFRRDLESNKILLELEGTKEELCERFDMQSIKLLYGLQKNAETASLQYSNADLSQLVENDINKWHPKKPNVNISRLETMINSCYLNGNGGEIRAQICLLIDFQAGCDRLAAYFSCCSRPVEDSFPQNNTGPGEIRLESDPDSSCPVILWVYHNVCVQIEMIMLESNVFNINYQQASEELDDFAKRIFQHIRNGMVARRDRRDLVKIPAPKSPDQTMVGETFDVEINTGPSGEYYDDVKYESRNIVFAMAKDFETYRKYTFLATAIGEAKIDFNFAHRKTFNSTTVSVSVLIIS